MKNKIWISIVAILVIAAIGKCAGLGGKGAAQSSAQSTTAPAATTTAPSTTPQSSDKPYVPKTPPPPRATATKTTPAATNSAEEVTTGGIGYSEATAACDLAAQQQLFPGRTYKSHTILGKQKGMIGLEPDQYLAAYNVKVDGRKTAINCLVDGTKDEVNVISIGEIPWS